MTAEGHCNCKAITVKMPTLPEQTYLCYCSNCRRSGSSAFGANYFMDRADIELLDPKGQLKSYRDSGTKSGNTITRQFCGTCGCPVLTIGAGDSSKVIVKSGLFDHIPEPAAQQFFTEQKASWVEFKKLGDKGHA
ncbi:Mss4-like protein [Massariosphaeria phaeospora]|uniref:Mss4-like protein n=1 Tax=Massariosphaeria phaeospora TaxID=100035 RepID=A0A7C8MAW7_9PLEO|nr:Mss4-like protein [Massariosphaeria phaeospora]